MVHQYRILLSLVSSFKYYYNILLLILFVWGGLWLKELEIGP